MNKVLLAAGAVILLAVIGYAIFSNRTSSSADTTTRPIATELPSTGVDLQGVVEINLEASEFQFNNSDITVAAGQKVRLTLKNTGNMRHDWVVEGQNISTETISGGSQTVLEFTAPTTPGVYVTFCSVGDHRSRGMVGKLIVQ